jgi:hypothetical protein
MNPLRSGSFVIAVVAGVAGSAAAQTNTFPSSGNVGIGTTSPGTALDVVGSVRASGANAFISTIGGGNWGFIQNDYSAGQGGNVYNLGFSSGAIGIMNGSVTAQDVYLINRNDPSAGYLVLKANGDVGIGTTNPRQTLEVNGAVQVDQAVLVGGVVDTEPSGGFWLNPSQTSGMADELSGGGSIAFRSGGTDDRMVITSGGNIGIATTNPAFPLSVNGTIEAKEVIVQTGWSDYVFDKGYRLEPLSEVEKTIEAEKHLPGMPSATEVAAHGVSVGEMESKLLAQLEEVTLRQIDEEKRIETLEAENLALKRQLAAKRNSIAQP